MGNRYIGKGLILTLATALVLALTFTSALAAPPEGKGKPPKDDGGGKFKNTPLCVTFRDNPTDNIRSDGNPTYCNHDATGIGLVAFGGNDVSGPFAFTTEGTKDPMRSITLNFDGECEGACSFMDFVEPGDIDQFRMESFHGLRADGRMGLILQFELLRESNITRSINFDPDKKSWACSSEPGNGDPVWVTNPCEGGWTLESLSGDEACLTETSSAAGGGFDKPKQGLIELGRYHMPFQLTLQTFSGNFDTSGPIGLAECPPPPDP